MQLEQMFLVSFKVSVLEKIKFSIERKYFNNICLRIIQEYLENVLI